MRALRYMASPWSTAALCMVLVSIYIAMSFGGAPYAPFIDFIFRSFPGLLLYLGLIVNLTAWSVQIIIKRAGKKVISPEAIMSMDGFMHLSPDSKIKDLEAAVKWFSARGFNPRSTLDGVSALKGALGIIPGIVLRAGFVLVMLSALVSAHIIESDGVLLIDGGAVAIFNMEVRAASIDAGLPEEFLNLGKVSFELDNISAALSFNGEEFTATGGYPSKAAGLYWRLRHLGYAQPVSVDGKDSLLMLDVLPPGAASAHSLISGGEAYEFRLAPEKAVKKGLISGNLFDLRAPRYELSPRGRKGKKITIKSGESASIGDSRVELSPPKLYVKLLAVRNPVLPLLRLGFLITSLGVLLMIVRLFWYERRIAAVMHDGRVLMGYSEEFYKKWAIYKFRKWTGSFL